MFKYAVIYAGGEGTRMLPLTNYVPKALVLINKIPLIDYNIKLLRKNNIKHIYVTYSYKGEQLLVHLKDKVDGFINTTNKDNAYFLYNSFIKFIDEPVICMPCDIIVDINFKNIYTENVKLKYPIHSIIPTKPHKNISGDFITFSNNIITQLNRKKKTELYASGIQIINPKRVNSLTTPKQKFNKVWEQLIKYKQLHLINIQPKKWKAYDTLNSIYE